MVQICLLHSFRVIIKNNAPLHRRPILLKWICLLCSWREYRGQNSLVMANAPSSPPSNPPKWVWGTGGRSTLLPYLPFNRAFFACPHELHPSSIYFLHSFLLFNCLSLFNHSFTVFTVHAFSLYSSLTQKTSLHSCPRIVRAVAQWTTNELYKVRGGKWLTVDRLHTWRFMRMKFHFIIHKILKNICINFQLVKENISFLLTFGDSA